MTADREREQERDREQLGDRAAAHARSENSPWSARAKVTDAAKKAEKLGGRSK